MTVAVTQIREFHRPGSVPEAWEMVRGTGERGRVIGGGTDLTIHCPPEVDTLVDLARCGLDGLEELPDGTIRVGAMATLTDLLEHPATASYGTGMLAEMLVHVGSPLLRNVATVGGHLARGFLSDVIPALLAMDASVAFYDGTEHETSLATYYEDGLNRRPHILIRLALPPVPEPSAASFLRFARSGFDHALANAACRVDLEEGLVVDARVVVGIGAGVARRVAIAEAALVGGALESGAISAAASLVPGVFEQEGGARAEYRRHLAGVLVERCLIVARRRLEEQP